MRGEVRHVRLDIDDQVPIIEEIFDREMNPFEGIDSNWQKEQFIKQHMATNPRQSAVCNGGSRLLKDP